MRSLRVAVVSFLVFLNLLLVKPPAFAAEVADSVYHNGIFYTVSEQTPKAEAVAIKDGKFIFVGSNEEVKAYIGSDTKVVDLEGKTVLPGLIESHMHYASYGALQMQIQAHWRPKEEILEAVKKAYPSAKEKGEWILGRGWNQEVWDPPQFPTRAELDAIAPDVPVYLVRTCGHAAWVNSKALEIAGITAETPDPEGGEIYRDEKGQPTGILTDTAMKLVSGKIPPLTEDQQRRALLAAQENLLSYGITTANDMGTSLETFNLMKELYEDGKLKIRIYAYGASGSYGKADATSYAPFLEMGPQKELY
ncbi:MAG TPA: amidohydrolase family protein, partial [Thermosynergistes sp.]|nr:amidohydrolase family protein [Thermosynergistes sp.]